MSNVMKLLMLILLSSALSGCDLSNHSVEANKNVTVVPNLELIKSTQKKDKMGEYQQFYSAPFKGGEAIIDAATPKGLEGNLLAIYWLQDNNQLFAINNRAEEISPAIPRYHQLPFEIDPSELLATVKNKY